MEKQDQTAAEQLEQIRRQRRELARQQTELAALEMATSNTLSDAAAALLSGNLALLDMGEPDFSHMVDTLRRVPSLRAQAAAVDLGALYSQIQALEAELAAMLTKHRAAENVLGTKLDKLRSVQLSGSTAAANLAAILDRYPVAARLPSVRL
jgi:hypothetical protein